MKKRNRILLVSLMILLLASVLGKWAVFEFVLDADETGRQRIDTGNSG